ncbi:MAG: hypothetical protein CMJ48_01625 [Planctomycetaceae bacterium]|nr:hypothetical protein [Planctomycetaceae bacterium]
MRSNATSVHFVSIFLLTLSIVLGVVAYLSWANSQQRSKEFAALKRDVNSLRTTVTTLDEERAELDRLLGFGGEHREVMEQLEVGLATHAGRPAPATVEAALRRVSRRLGDVTLERDDLTDDKLELERNLTQSNEVAEARVGVEQTAREEAQRDLSDVRRGYEETMADSREKMLRMQADIEAAILELDEKGGSIADLRAELAEVKRNHSRTVAFLNGKLKRLQSDHFEKPDGKVVLVDSITHSIWIDLGSADNVETGLKMKVYSGRDGTVKSKPKGEVVITKIVGRHQAQARILNEELTHPILRDDLVYTPLWTAGLVNTFAFVGTMDIDGDGSDDTARLLSQVRAAGAKVHSYVDDNGKRVGSQIDGSVKLLVVGAVPEDPSQATTRDGEQVARKIVEHVTQMRREAEEFGIEVVSLREFLERTGIRSAGASKSKASVNRSSSVRGQLSRLRQSR